MGLAMLLASHHSGNTGVARRAVELLTERYPPTTELLWPPERAGTPDAESLAETMFRFTRIVMLMAPIGVGAAIAYTVGQLGLGILVNLFQLLATFYVAVAIFVIIVLLPVAYLAKLPIRRFAQAVAEPISIAFATESKPPK